MPYVLPTKWKEFDNDPALNNKPPPKGAPEATTRKKDLNDIDRFVMASIHEMGEWIENILGVNADSTTFVLGNMATQDKGSVDIDGGTMGNVDLDNQCTVPAACLTGTINNDRLPTNVNALTFNTQTAQQWYNDIYPVGSIYICYTNKASIPLPTGVTATWVKIGYEGRLLMVADAPGAYPDLSGTTGNVPLSVVGGETEDVTLTVDQIPAHAHSYSRTGGSGSVIGGGGPYSNVVAGDTGSVGGGQAHRHALGARADLRMNLGANVPALKLQFWRRTA